MSILKPTWYEMDRGSAILAVHFEDMYGAGNMPFEYIVGVVQGGLFPAMILSGLFDIPLVPAGVRPIDGVDSNLTQLPSIYGNVVSGTGLLDDLPTLLIVGHETSYDMNRVIHHYLNEEGHEVITAAVYHRENSAGLRPSFFWRSIQEDDDIQYPWESFND